MMDMLEHENVVSRYSASDRITVEGFAERLLPGWNVELREDCPEGDEECDGSIEWGVHTFEARIWLSDKVLNDREMFYRVLTHELCHPLFRDLRLEFLGDAPPAVADRWEHMEELLIERITPLIAASITGRALD